MCLERVFRVRKQLKEKPPMSGDVKRTAARAVNNNNNQSSAKQCVLKAILQAVMHATELIMATFYCLLLFKFEIFSFLF